MSEWLLQMGDVLMLFLTYIWAEVFNPIPELHFLKQAGSTVKPSLFYGMHCSKKGEKQQLFVKQH